MGRLPRLGWARLEGKFYAKGGAGVRDALDTHSTPKSSADGFYDRQSKPGTSQLPGPRPVDSVEPLKHMRQSFLGNADACVRNFKDGLPVYRNC